MMKKITLTLVVNFIFFGCNDEDLSFFKKLKIDNSLGGISNEILNGIRENDNTLSSSKHLILKNSENNILNSEVPQEFSQKVQDSLALQNTFDFENSKSILSIDGNMLSIDYNPNKEFTGNDKINFTFQVSASETFTVSFEIHVVTNHTWTGLGTDNKWSNSKNWCGSLLNEKCQGNLAPPSNQDIAVFDSLCLSNCEAKIQTPINVKGIKIAKDFTGKLFQESEIELGSSGFLIDGGEFVGGNSPITLSGNFIQNGGVFKSTNNTLLQKFQYSQTPILFEINGGQFQHNMGTIKFYSSASLGGHYIVEINKIKMENPVDFYNLILEMKDTNSYSGFNNVGIGIVNSDKLSVLNDLTIVDGELLGNDVKVHKNIHAKCAGLLSCAGSEINTEMNGRNGGGSGTIKLVGSEDSLIFAEEGSLLPNLVIEKSSENINVSLDSSYTSLSLSSFELIEGTFNAPSVSLKIGTYLGWNPNWKNELGEKVQYPDFGFIVHNGAFFKHNNGSVIFNGQFKKGGHSVIGASIIDTPENFSFYNLSIDVKDHTHYGNKYNNASVYILTPHPVIVQNDLNLIDGELWGGQITLLGNVHSFCKDREQEVVKSCFGGPVNVLTDGSNGGGTTLISMEGNKNSNYFFQDGSLLPPLVINKSNMAKVSPGENINNLSISEFQLISGTFIAPPNELKVGNYRGWSAGDNNKGFFIKDNNSIFDTNNGTIEFNGSIRKGGHHLTTVSKIDVPENFTFNNFILNIQDHTGHGAPFNNGKLTLAPNKKINIAGDFIGVDGEIWGASIGLKGNLLYKCADFNQTNMNSCAGNGGPLSSRDGRFGGGTTEIILEGNQEQKYDFEIGAKAPLVTINTTGIVSPLNENSNFNVAKFKLINGDFHAPQSSIFEVGYFKGYEYEHSGADDFSILGGQFHHNSGSVTLNPRSRLNNNHNIATINVPDNFEFFNLTLNVSDEAGYEEFNQASIQVNSNSTILVKNNLTVVDGVINGGTFNYVNADFTETSNEIKYEGGTSLFVEISP